MLNNNMYSTAAIKQKKYTLNLANINVSLTIRFKMALVNIFRHLWLQYVQLHNT